MSDTNALIKAIDDADSKVRAVRDMAVEADQWWLFKPISKAVSSVLGITEALLEQKASQQTEEEASETPKAIRQRRQNGAAIEPSNSPQSNRVLAP